MIAGKFPVVLVDGFYERPDDIRTAALTLQFRPPTNQPYPGKLAQIPANPSLLDAVNSVTQMANSEFLPRADIEYRGTPVTALRVVSTDFAIVDMHPTELEPVQRKPHIDPVAVFGLVYLNHESRGGTLFFRQTTEDTKEVRIGYLTVSDEHFELLGKIEPRFNRLAIYPGFVLHSGEIAGDWIENEERFTNPRLTQRFAFHF